MTPSPHNATRGADGVGTSSQPAPSTYDEMLSAAKPMTDFHSPQEHLNAQDMQDEMERNRWLCLAAALVALIALGCLLAASILWPHFVSESVTLNQIVEGLE